MKAVHYQQHKCPSSAMHSYVQFLSSVFQADGLKVRLEHYLNIVMPTAGLEWWWW